MAETPRRNYVKRPLDPPPSTLAAQIVLNLESVEKRPRSTNAKENLRELLHLILEDEEERNSTQRNSEEAIEENRRLIVVIARACLEPLLERDPFEDEKALRTEAQECLSVICITVQRFPEALFVLSTLEPAAGHPRGPLYLWLVPKLIVVLTTNEWDAVRESCMSALKACIKADSKALSLRFGLRPLTRFLRNCLRDICHRVSCLENRVEAHENHRVPSDRTVSALGMNLTDIRTDICALPYHGAASDISYAVHILFAFTEQECSTVQPWKLTRSTSPVMEIDWIVDYIATLLEFSSYSGILATDKHIATCITLLSTLRTCLAHSLENRDEVRCLKSAVLAYKFLAHLVVRHGDEFHRLIDKSMCRLTVCLCYASQISPGVMQQYLENLDQPVQNFLTNDRLRQSATADLQRVLMIISHLGLVDDTPLPYELMNFDDLELRDDFENCITQRVFEDSVEDEHAPRPSKRIRLSGSDNRDANILRTLRDKVRHIFGFHFDIEPAASPRLKNAFQTMPQVTQCQVLNQLALMACANGSSINEFEDCDFCDQKKVEAWTDDPVDGELFQVLYKTLEEFSRIVQEQKMPKPRVAAMHALSRLLAHSGVSQHFDIRDSSLGQWCCQSLKSSVRDLRMAAISSLEHYLNERLGGEILRYNRLTCLEYLRSIADRNDWNLQEACICGLGLIGRSSSEEEERNIVLLRLVEFLGHASPFVSSLAYEELSRLASTDATNARQLFDPYWRTVAVLIVKNLQTRPQIAQSVCDLLGIHVTELLQRTQFYTIPYLVYKGNVETLQRIAKANGSNESTHSLCYQHGQLAAILAFLLLQPNDNPGELVTDSMARVSERFSALTLPDLLKCDTMYMAFELLKIAGERESSTTQHANQIFQYLTEVFYNRPKSSKSTEIWKEEALGAFFDTWALAIVQLLSESITETKGPQPIFERRRCIGAFAEMARLAQHRLSNALPQVRSCLQAAIEDRRLRNDAFLAWFTLLENLESQDIQSLIDQTFALLVQHWETLDTATQTKAYNAISNLLADHNETLLEMIETIPSLANIPLLSKFETEIKKLKSRTDEKRQFWAFIRRCQSESVTVVSVALKELQPFLVTNQGYLQSSAISEEPDPLVGALTRSLLDACIRFKDVDQEVAIACARCLGLIGCIDPSRVEAPREDRQMLVLSNFAVGTETVDFVLFFLQEVLVKVYLMSTVTARQQILAFGMQELLKRCDMVSSVTFKRGLDEQYKKWINLPESTRHVLTPFLTSKYVINAPTLLPERRYPIFEKRLKYNRWVHDFTLDLLQKAQGENATVVFAICRRLVRNQDVSIANFLLPYALLNVVVEGSEQDLDNIATELYAILATPIMGMDISSKQNLIQCSQNVFRVVDYLSRWAQERRKLLAAPRGRGISKDQRSAESQFQSIDILLHKIPAEIMSSRAVDCKNYARALFYWEQHIRDQRKKGFNEHVAEPLYERLQDIYTQIDEPDGIEGISAYLQNISFEQQMVADRNAGRWSSVQSWYELQLTERPHDAEVQYNLAMSLRETGQHNPLLNLLSELGPSSTLPPSITALAIEATWCTARWDLLSKYTDAVTKSFPNAMDEFNIAVGSALCSLHRQEQRTVNEKMRALFLETLRPLTLASTSTLQACHRPLLRFHALVELEMIAGLYGVKSDRTIFVSSLDRRLEMLNTFPADQAYLLGLRRAVMQLTPSETNLLARPFAARDISTTWLKSAKIARKAGYTSQAIAAVIRAQELKDPSATIEYARLMWGAGNHRKAMQTLEAAIDSNAFQGENVVAEEDQSDSRPQSTSSVKNSVSARAHLLLARWIDRAGQSQSIATVQRYRNAISLNSHWEKSHVQLGKHYNKLLESEKANPPAKQAQTFITGEMAKLVIENFVRSLPYGTKYIYQTLPKLLTLWMDLGVEVDKPLDSRFGDQSFRDHTQAQRRKIFNAVQNGTFKKYVERLPGFVLYTAFSQIVARITHPNKDVAERLVDFVVKVVTAHPQQALWPILAMMKSRASSDRAKRGLECKVKLMERAKSKGTESTRVDFPTRDIPQLLASGQRLTDQLVDVCNKTVDKDAKNPVSLLNNLGFNHKRAVPSRLAIPIQATLLAKLPPANGGAKDHRAFSKDTVTISAFLDDASVLNSLAKPRRVKIRGSDGRIYSILCKPKDDLRKDQRLLEFNSMISRILKRDAECSRRRLYIKTYAVTPLNEECGLIEWVDGMKTLREILLNSYRQMGVQIDYEAIRGQLNAITADQDQVGKFKDEVLARFPPVLHDWFVDHFPEPEVWFNARLRYTRSCAVMSMVGHVLGLGDRHGENILLEEQHGGTFHVDFNCLFDKGKTFETPERVPFRLTHNMVDAFGAYYENGPFRRSCELTLSILRQNEDTLMTILETFLYDPTADFIGKKKSRHHSEVPDTPEGVLESVRHKVRGLLPLESVPLSVEGYVQLLIEQATDPYNLARMYIGWCPFL